MSPHDFSADGKCKHCGTLSINVNQTACPGPQTARVTSILPPVPERRILAADDAETISARIAQLREERTAAMNEKVKD